MQADASLGRAQKASPLMKKSPSYSQLDLSASKERMDPLQAAKQRAALEEQLREAFRDHQKQLKKRHVEQIVLGRGLGTPAEETLVDGVYNPQKVLQPITDEEKRLWTTIKIGDIPNVTRMDEVEKPPTPSRVRLEEIKRQISAEKKARRVSALPPLGGDESPTQSENKSPVPPEFVSDDDDDQQSDFPFLDRFRCSYKPSSIILDARDEVEGNIDMAERELDELCKPYTFAEIVDTLDIALDVVEKGDLKVKVSLPTYFRSPPPEDPEERAAFLAAEAKDPLFLVGAVDVMAYIREHTMPLAYSLIPVTHTSEWVVQYTVAFLRSLHAKSMEEAQIRVELLSRCIRLMGRTEHFTSMLLTFESKAEEYDAFDLLQESAEVHMDVLLGEIEETLKTIESFPFPTRRQRLQMVEKGIEKKLKRVLLMLTEIDYNWAPTVRFQSAWKVVFLSACYKRIHELIAPKYLKCTLGFVDAALYKMVNDSRVSGKYAGSSPIQPKVPTSRQVEYERVTEKYSFQQVGIGVKGVASLIVGGQVCMGARYLVKQGGPEFDEAWGFAMNEKAAVPSQEQLDKMVEKMTARAKRMNMSSPIRQPKSTTFITQDTDV